MAKELHDGLGSMLSGIKHSFTAMKNKLTLNKNEQDNFNTNIEKLNDSISEIRNISHSMASDSLLQYGLENSLRDYCRNLSQSGDLNISFNALDTVDILLNNEEVFHPSAATTSASAQPMVATRVGVCSIVVDPWAWVIVTG